MTDECIETVSDAGHQSAGKERAGKESAGIDSARHDLLEAPATRLGTGPGTESVTLRPPFKTRLWNEIRTHPFGYSVLGIFLVAGPLAAPFLFPQAPPAAAVVGGLAFAVYAAVSAVPQKFL